MNFISNFLNQIIILKATPFTDHIERGNVAHGLKNERIIELIEFRAQGNQIFLHERIPFDQRTNHRIRCNRKFLAGLKKAGLVGEGRDAKWGKAYEGGYKYWVSVGGQSMQKKEAFAYAFAEVLQKHGLTVYAGSRMD